MKAALLTGPRTIELADSDPPPVAPAQVRLRVLQCGVCMSDVDRWAGRGPDGEPERIGHEVAGIVEELGADVSGLTKGQCVAAWVPGGGFAEEIAAEAACCIPVADHVSYPAIAEPLACVVNAVELAAPALADDVLIIGAGFMGTLIQLVTALKGPRTITVADMRRDALGRASGLGAASVIDISTESLPDAIQAATEGRGADLAYEVTGVSEGLRLAGEATRMSGKICIVAYHQGAPRTIPLGHWNWMAFDIINAHFRNLDTIMGGMRKGMRLVNGGIIDVSALVTHTFRLTQITEAFEIASTKPESFIKAVVQP